MVPGIGIAGDFIGAVLIANKPHNLYGGLMGWPFEKVGQLRLILVLFFLVEGGYQSGEDRSPGSVFVAVSADGRLEP